MTTQGEFHHLVLCLCCDIVSSPQGKDSLGAHLTGKKVEGPAGQVKWEPSASFSMEGKSNWKVAWDPPANHMAP